jgi:endonuclease/exonuclease/phosphatase family metal-dependent hydrolase
MTIPPPTRLAVRQLLVSLASAILALTAGLSAQPPRGFLAKPASTAIRVLTWNVYRSSIFPANGETVDLAATDRPARFARVVRAVRPDILCLQEVTVGVPRTAALLDRILPLGEGRSWQVHGAEDTVVASRFDLGARAEGYVQGAERRRGHAIALVKAPTTDLYVVCAHFQSSADGADAALRQQQAELIAKTIRNAQSGDGDVPLRRRTPFVLLGDFNAIPGGTSFLDDLVSGRAGGVAANGRIEGLDWDRSSLADARPRHNASGSERYTWRNDLERFPPGVLDRILYSDSVLSSVNQFVLDTTEMSYTDLFRAGLRAVDVMRDPQAGIHDHYPLVIDLILRSQARRLAPARIGPPSDAAPTISRGR